MHYEYEDSASQYRWPPEPDSARYVFVGQLSGEANFPASTQNFGSRVLSWLVGLHSAKREPVVLQRPQNGFTDAQGRIYVTDVSRAAVMVFDQPAGKLLVWGSAGQGGHFDSPVGIAAGANDEILVADAALKKVVRLNQAGEPLGDIGKGVLMRPVGIARDAARNRIFVSDAQAHDIKIFSDTGELLGHIGEHGEGAGEFNAPTYLTWTGDQLYVTDTLNSRVQIFDAGGVFVREFGRRGLFVGDLPRPKGIAVDSRGNIYVVESYYDHLLVFNAKGELLLPIGGSGSGIGEFFLPAGVWTDGHDRIYVADSFNGRVVIFQFLGET
ncbi:MAG: 6-bladed beta-propeller [Chromatiales bacterium]|jgi:DNA-binding beta-propeller fold protein YncE|nr:6-bladed beta-propeller [Chromatiales bacterium]